MEVARRTFLLSASSAIAPAGIATLFARIAASQNAISTHAGLLNHFEGQVAIGGKPVRTVASFPHVLPGQELRTEKGRAEILLNPGAFLRVDENSGVRMLSNALTDTRVQAIAGSILLEYTALDKESSVTLIAGSSEVTFREKGAYRIDVEEALVSVYSGEAVIVRGREALTLRSGMQSATATNALDARELPGKARDALFDWCTSRSDFVSMTTCFATSHRDYPSQHPNFYHSVYGAVYLPGPNYCRRFLGPLLVLDAGNAVR
jgi:hypothetical protein